MKYLAVIKTYLNIDNFIFLLIASFLVLLPAFPDTCDGIVFILLLIWIGKCFKGRVEFEKNNPIAISILLLIAALTVAFIFNYRNIIPYIPAKDSKFFPIQQLLAILAPLILFFILSSIPISQPKKICLLYLMLGSFLLWMIYFCIRQYPLYFGNRLSFLGSPNIAGSYIAMICIILSIFLYFEKKLFLIIIEAGFILFNLILLLFTYCRGAWIGLAGSFLLLSIILFKNKKFHKIVLIIIGISVLCFLFYPGFTERLNTLTSLNNSVNVERLTLWKNAISIFKHLPWLSWGPNKLTGIGLNMFMQHYHSPTFTHHNFIQLFLEFGILGGIFFIIFLTITFIEVFKLIIKSKDQFILLLAISVLGSLVMWTIHGFMDVTFFFKPNMYLFMTLLAFCFPSNNNKICPV